MGGHAFAYLLSTPRISRDLYLEVRSQAAAALRCIFAKVVVPTEMPDKSSFGDVDFLVAGSFVQNPGGAFDYPLHVRWIKNTLGTTHGRKGFATDRVMFFAIPAREGPEDIWVQIDVRVCEHEELFEWERFQLQYASAAKMLGSMLKPLGVTLSPEGCWLRLEGFDGLDCVNLEDTLLWVTRDPTDVLKLLGLNRQILEAGFQTNVQSKLGNDQ